MSDLYAAEAAAATGAPRWVSLSGNGIDGIIAQAVEAAR